MKYLFFLIFNILGSICFSQNLRVKFNPVSLVASTFNMQAEMATKSKQSFQLGLLYGSIDSYGRTISGIGITPEYRFYSDSTHLKLYLAPFVRYFALKENSVDSTPENINGKTNINRFAGGFVIGYVGKINKYLSWEVFCGPSFYYTDLNFQPGSTAEYIEDAKTFSTHGFTFRIGSALSVKF